MQVGTFCLSHWKGIDQYGKATGVSVIDPEPIAKTEVLIESRTAPPRPSTPAQNRQSERSHPECVYDKNTKGQP